MYFQLINFIAKGEGLVVSLCQKYINEYRGDQMLRNERPWSGMGEN